MRGECISTRTAMRAATITAMRTMNTDANRGYKGRVHAGQEIVRRIPTQWLLAEISGPGRILYLCMYLLIAFAAQ